MQALDTYVQFTLTKYHTKSYTGIKFKNSENLFRFIWSANNLEEILYAPLHTEKVIVQCSLNAESITAPYFSKL